METKQRKHKLFGRPPLSVDEKRSVRVSVFLTESESAQLSEKAENTNLSAPEFLRRSGLGRKIESQKSSFDREAVLELRQISQIIKRLRRDVTREIRVNSSVNLRRMVVILEKQLEILNDINLEITK